MTEKKYDEMIRSSIEKIASKIRNFIGWFNHITGVRWPEIVTALATVVLAGVTWQYVVLTKDLVGKQSAQVLQQQQQFELINRARVTIKDDFPVGDVNSSNLTFVNIGNLPAENVKLAWKMVQVQNDKVLRILPEPSKSNILSQDKTEITVLTALDPEENVTLLCSSHFDNQEDFVFLIICWKYKGAGIKDYRLKDQIFLWLKPQSAWAVTSIIGASNLKAINSVKTELKEALYY